MTDRFAFRLMIIASLAIHLASGCAKFGHKSQSISRRTPRAEKPVKLPRSQQSSLQTALARSVEESGEVDRAKSLYETIIDQDRKYAPAYHRLAILHGKRGEFDESDKLFRTAMKLDADNPDFHCDFGYSLYLQERWQDAEGQFRKAVSLNRNHQRAHNNLGLLLARTDRPDAAMAEFRLAGCSVAEGHMNVAFALTVNHRLQDARDQYQLAVAADRTSQTAADRLRQLDSLIAQLDQHSQETLSGKPTQRSPTKAARIPVQNTAGSGFAHVSFEEPEDSASRLQYTPWNSKSTSTSGESDGTPPVRHSPLNRGTDSTTAK